MTCDELINVSAASAHSEILAETKHAKYVRFVSIGFTPDTARFHQLNIIIQYCTNSGQIIERFLGFISVQFRDGQ
jgi:hypothetical protein